MDSRLDSCLVWIMDDMIVRIEWFVDSVYLIRLPCGSLSPDDRLSLCAVAVWLDAHRKASRSEV